MLRESAMCPDADKGSFEDIARHKYFNTTNLWVNLPMLKAREGLPLSLTFSEGCQGTRTANVTTESAPA